MTGILVPIFILVMGFSPKYAIPLSNVTILGGSIMNMVMNVSKRSVSLLFSSTLSGARFLNK